jgi:hypothetical protein
MWRSRISASKVEPSREGSTGILLMVLVIYDCMQLNGRYQGWIYFASENEFLNEAQDSTLNTC